MTSRENRKQRREAERKARKLANKQSHTAPASPAPSPELSQPHPATAAYLAEMRAKADRELDEEFGAEFMAHAREVSDRMARRFGFPVSSGPFADVAWPEPCPVVKAGSEIPMPPTQYGTENPISASRPLTQNRQNAQDEAASLSEPKIQNRSTGPRTPEGKLAAFCNSLKHGLASGALIIPGEDPAAFETLGASLLREHQPADATEQILVDQLAQSHWLLQRAIRFQNDCFTLDGIDEKRLALFIRYGPTHERSFHKALNTLLRLKRERQKAQSASAPGFVSQNPAPPFPQPSPSGFVSQIEGFLDPDSAQSTKITSEKSPARPAKLPDAA